MTSHILSSPPRLVASGGPVTRAVLAGRGEGVEAERRRLSAQCAMLRERILADAAMVETLRGRIAELSGAAA